LKPSAGAALAYSVLSVVLTWPLTLGIAGDVPGDLGDSLLNMWILAWGAEHVPQLLTGALSWSGFWNANIFHPEPLTLALSEHLFGQTLQILPVYWLTGNIILCYNLLFLSSFALSALGMFLLVRDLTGNARAAFSAAPAGAELAVDAVCAVRVESIPDHRFNQGVRRRYRRARSPELVLRLLPSLLRAVRASLRRPSHVGGWHRAQFEDVADADGFGCGHVDSLAAVSLSVSGSAATLRHRAAAWRSDSLLGQRVVVSHRCRERASLWQVAALLPSSRR
jgi:hypothetical protein